MGNGDREGVLWGVEARSTGPDKNSWCFQNAQNFISSSCAPLLEQI